MIKIGCDIMIQYVYVKTESEIYKPVNYPRVIENWYSISNYGNVYSFKSQRNLSIWKDRYGYDAVSLKGINGKKINVNIHRLVAWEFVNGYDDNVGKTWVNHINADHTWNFYKNLEWVTQRENIEHGMSVGYAIIKRGEDNNMSIFSEETVRHICEMYQSGYTKSQIMKAYGYRKKTHQSFYSLITHIKSRNNWKWVSDEYDF